MNFLRFLSQTIIITILLLFILELIKAGSISTQLDMRWLLLILSLAIILFIFAKPKYERS